MPVSYTHLSGNGSGRGCYDLGPGRQRHQCCGAGGGVPGQTVPDLHGCGRCLHCGPPDLSLIHIYFDLRDTKGQQKIIEDQISAAADILRQGGLVGIPTETVYGLGAVSYTHLIPNG